MESGLAIIDLLGDEGTDDLLEPSVFYYKGDSLVIEMHLLECL